MANWRIGPLESYHETPLTVRAPTETDILIAEVRMTWNRRDFVKQSASGLAVWGAWPGTFPATMPADSEKDLKYLSSIVKFTGDGPSLSPLEYVSALQNLIHEADGSADYYAPSSSVDYYSLGGPVEELERKMASVLGKEYAVFLPTGTLANHLAIRALAQGKKRVLVQKDSHIYNDSGDCAQVLSNLNLVPLADSSATFTLEDVKAIVGRTESGRVTTGVGVIMIESPVRRRRGEMFDYDTMRDICEYARSRGIATHLDGARLFMASGYSGISPAEYATHFDTVYVSMWKYFNAPSGAILAGPKALLEDLFHARRMFGGGLPHAWPFALLALHAIDGFDKRFRAGVEHGRQLFVALDRHDDFRIEHTPNGTNVVKLHVAANDLQGFRRRLRDRGVLLSSPASGWDGFSLSVNETLTRKPVDELVNYFTQSLI